MKRLLFLLLAFPPAAFGQAYANPKLCAGCHPAINRTYHQNGMGRSFSSVRPEILIEDFTRNNTYYHAPSDTHYEMLRRGDRIFQRRYQIGFDNKQTNVDEKQIDFIVGSGNHMRTYTQRNPDGTLIELPLAWYAEKGGYWAMNPGYDSPDYPYARRQIAYDCMFCHNAYPKTPPGHDRLGDLPVYAGTMPEGIDCQRCHGPGQRHVEVASTVGAKTESIRAAILNPARLSNDRQIEVCAQCHLKTTEFRLPHAIRRYERADFSYNPSEPLSSFALTFDEAPGPAKSNRFETASAVTRMRESQCFLKSAGALKCTTCHNPHDIQHGSEAVSHYNSVCRECHAAPFNQMVAAAKHTAQTDCIDCHMPKRRTEDIVHMVVTDHLIQRRKPAGDLLADLVEHHYDGATAYHGEVVPYDPERLSDTPAGEFYLALAQVRDGANLEKGIPQLEKALTAMGNPRAEAWLDLGDAYKIAGQLKQAVDSFQKALHRDPTYLPAWLELGSTLKTAGQPVQSAAAAKRATEIAPSDARAWNALGQAELDISQPAAAIPPFRRALTIDAEMPEAHNGLGIALAQGGDVAGGETELREAIRILPNYGEPHGNLANLLAWKQDLRQAAYEFDKALHLNPRDTAARFNYATMLNGMRRFEDAQVQLEEAIEANPAFAEAHDLLGTLLERRGSVDEALKEYQEAVRLKPELSHAQLDLGAVLQNKGDRAAALEHLRLAAKSSDPNLRQLAQRLLQQLN